MRLYQRVYMPDKARSIMGNKSLEYYGLMANIQLLVSDYNYNNADWNIQRKQVVLKGNFKPKYLNKAHESKENMWYNRQLVYEGTFEEGIQSG